MRFLQKMRCVPLLASLLLLLVLTTAASVSAHPIAQPGMQLTNPAGLTFPPIITYSGADKGGLRQVNTKNKCFFVAISGTRFSPPGPKYTYKAKLTATGTDELLVHPGEIKINAKGEFTKNFKVCGVTSSFEMITIHALDKLTQTESNTLLVAASNPDAKTEFPGF